MMRLGVLLVLGGCGFHGPMLADAEGGGGDGSLGDSRPDGDGSRGGDATDGAGGGWSMALTITDAAATVMPVGFQVGFAIDLDQAPCSGDRASVHVWWQGHDIVRVIDELGTGNEWTWFPLQAPIAAGAISTEYTLTCHDPAGTAPSDPTTVFDFVDKFANLDNWTTQGPPTVSGGVVTLPSNDGAVVSTAQYGPDRAVDFWLSVASPATNDVWGGFQDQLADNRPWLIWYTFSAPSKIYPAFCDATTSPCGNGPLSAAAEQPLDTAWHLYGVENCGATTALWRLADQPVFTAPLMNYAGSHRIRLDNFNTNALVKFRDVRVRKAACPPPTVSVGAAIMQ